MKRSLVFTLAAIAVLALAIVGSAAAADTTVSHVITASGTGSVIGSPDRAQLTFSVQTENADVKAAQAANAAQMTAVMNALKAAGIPDDAMKTTGYNIYPVYNDEKTPLGQKVKTYQVTNTLTVTLHDVSRAGEVLDIAVANGINQASSIQFMLSDEQSHVLRTEALKEAVARARSDANTVAAAMGVNITGVNTADIGGGYSPVYYQNYQYDQSAKVAGTVPTPIQPGDVTVTATVNTLTSSPSALRVLRSGRRRTMAGAPVVSTRVSATIRLPL